MSWKTSKAAWLAVLSTSAFVGCSVDGTEDLGVVGQAATTDCATLQSWVGNDWRLSFAAGELVEHEGEVYQANQDISYPNAQCAPDAPASWCASWFTHLGACGTDTGDPEPTETCDDGIQNQDETDVDCGGSCEACPVEETCDDGIQNQDETGVDCGGSCAACETTDPGDVIESQPGDCTLTSQCKSMYDSATDCKNNLGGVCYCGADVCTTSGSTDPAPTETCSDGVQNQDETGVDCGGSCPACSSDGGSDPSSSVPSAPSGYRWEAVDELTDEFNGSTIDASKWDDYHPHWSGRAPSQFLKGACFVEDGALKLRSTMMKDPSTVSDPFSDIWVNSAACVSKEKSAKPGYFYEARIKASSLSMTSSFWFRVGDYSEIDVIEHIGNPSQENRQDDLPYEYHANTHFYGTQPGNSVAASWEMPTRGRDEYHTYGFWWKDAKTLWFYHNGVKVMEITPSGSAAENLKMVFDTEVFPFATAGVANIGLPLPENLQDDTKNTMYVDWVHTYKLVAN